MVKSATKFVSQKIKAIRWQPTSKQVIQKPENFATGSWDNLANNSVCMWTVNTYHDYSDYNDKLIKIPEGEPQLLCNTKHIGDVFDLKFLTNEQIVTCSSNGSLYLFKYHPRSQTIALNHTWSNIHSNNNQNFACTSIATRGSDTIISVGEDGNINLLTVEHRLPTQKIEEAESCTINCVTFIKHSEVATVNSIGQLKVWDLRKSSQEAVNFFHLSGERIPLQCLDKHPTQPHIVATGGADGALCIWDMRQEKFPVTLLNAHESHMWGMKFHPSHPDSLFTCSEDGTLWHWNAEGVNAMSHSNSNVSLKASHPTKVNVASSSCAWLLSEASKHRLDITSLLPGNIMPVNCLDVEESTVLCGTDGEQIYTINDLVVK